MLHMYTNKGTGGRIEYSTSRNTVLLAVLHHAGRIFGEPNQPGDEALYHATSHGHGVGRLAIRLLILSELVLC